MNSNTSDDKSDMLNNQLSHENKQMKAQLRKSNKIEITKMENNTNQKKRDTSPLITEIKQINKKMSAIKRTNSSGSRGVGSLPDPGVATPKQAKAVQRIPNPFSKDIVPQYLWNRYASPYYKKKTMGGKMAIIAQHQNVTVRSLPDITHVNDSLNIIKRRERRTNDRQRKTDWGVNSVRAHEFKTEKVKVQRRKVEFVTFQLENNPSPMKSILRTSSYGAAQSYDFNPTIEEVSQQLDRVSRKILALNTRPKIYSYEHMQTIPTIIQSFMACGLRKTRTQKMKDDEVNEAHFLKWEKIMSRFVTRVKKHLSEKKFVEQLSTDHNVYRNTYHNTIVKVVLIQEFKDALLDRWRAFAPLTHDYGIELTIFERIRASQFLVNMLQVLPFWQIDGIRNPYAYDHTKCLRCSSKHIPLLTNFAHNDQYQQKPSLYTQFVEASLESTKPIVMGTGYNTKKLPDRMFQQGVNPNHTNYGKSQVKRKVPLEKVVTKIQRRWRKDFKRMHTIKVTAHLETKIPSIAQFLDTGVRVGLSYDCLKPMFEKAYRERDWIAFIKGVIYGIVIWKHGESDMVAFGYEALVAIISHLEGLAKSLYNDYVSKFSPRILYDKIKGKFTTIVKDNGQEMELEGVQTLNPRDPTVIEGLQMVREVHRDGDSGEIVSESWTLPTADHHVSCTCATANDPCEKCVLGIPAQCRCWKATRVSAETQSLSDVMQFFKALIPKFMSYVGGIFNTSFYQKLLQVVTTGFLTKIFSLMGYSSIGDMLTTLVQSVDFAKFSFDTFISLITSGWEFVYGLITGDHKVHTPPDAKWLMDVDILLGYTTTVAKIGTWQPDLPQSERLRMMLMELARLEKEGRIFLSAAQGPAKYQFATRIAQISHAVTIVDKQLSTIRYIPAPFPIHLVGGAGMGKTASQSIICAAVAPIFNASPTDTYIMPMSEFQSGYGGQKIVVFDDLNQLKDTQSNNPINNIWININSNNKTIANMPDLPDKGKVFFNAHVVIATSNLNDAGSQNMFVYPNAGLRRLAHVVRFDIVPYEGNNEEYIGKNVVQYNCFKRVIQGRTEKQEIIEVDHFKTYCQYKMARRLAMWAKDWKEEQTEFAEKLNNPPTSDEIVETIQGGNEIIRVINLNKKISVGVSAVKEYVRQERESQITTAANKFLNGVSSSLESTGAWHIPTYNFGTHWLMRMCANPIREFLGLRVLQDHELQTETHSYVFSVLMSPFIQQGIIYGANIATMLTLNVYIIPVTIFSLYMSEIINKGWNGLYGAIIMHFCSLFGPPGLLLHFIWDFCACAVNYSRLTLPEIPQDNRKISGIFGLAALFFLISTVYVTQKRESEVAEEVKKKVEEAVKQSNDLKAAIRDYLNPPDTDILDLRPMTDPSAKVQSGYGDVPSDYVVKGAQLIDDRIASKHYTNIEGAPTNSFQKQMISFMPNTGCSEERMKKIRSAIKEIDWCDGSNSHGTLIGTMILTATHCIRENEEGKIQFSIKHNTEKTEYVVDKAMVKTSGELAYINTIKVFPKSLSIDYLATYDGRSGSIEVVGKQTSFTRNIYCLSDKDVICDICYPDKKGAGSSGHPIIFVCPQSIHIVGVHVGSGDAAGYGKLLTDTFIQTIKTTRPLLEGGTVVSYDAKLSLDFENQLKLNQVPDRSLVHYISDAQLQTLYPTMIVAGQVSNSFGIEKSRFIETPLKQHLDESSTFSTDKYTIPTFKPWVKEEGGVSTWINPHLVNLSQINQNVNFIRQDWIIQAIPVLAALLAKAAKFSLKPPITMQQCMNGIPGILNSIDLRTSAGPGYPGVKGEWVVGIHPNIYPNEKITKDLITLLDVIDTGVFIRPVYRASLKDEIIKREKNSQGKVRQFYGCNMTIQILTRILFAPMFIWMAQNRHQLPFKIGVNATSSEWEQIYREFIKRGNYYESDISAFDKKNSFQHIGIMVMIEIMFLYKYTPEQIARALLLGWSNVYFFLDVMGVIIEMFACAPSGAPGTTYNNSFTVLFVLFMAYVMSVGFKKNIDFISALFTEEVREFFSHVYICIYGDDLALAADDYCLSYLNGEIIFKVFNIFGFTLTKADKSAGIPEFHTDVTKVTFLKRRFYVQTLKYFKDDAYHIAQIVTAPLERSSIDKMLAYFENKGGIQMNDYLPIVIENAMKEEFLAGKDNYEERLRFFQSLPDDLKTVCKIDRIKTFDEMAQAYMNQTIDGSAFWVWA